MRTTRHLAACLTVLGLAVVSAACGGGDDEAGAIESGLHQIPMSVLDAAAVADGPMIAIADLVAVGELNDLSPPGPGQDADQIRDWTTGLAGLDAAGGSRVAVNWNADPSPTLVGPEPFEDEIGLDVGAIESYAALTAPPLAFVAYTGDITMSSSLDDLGDGVFTSGSGDDFQVDIDGVTDLRRIGTPLRLGARKNAVALSTSTRAITSWLDEGSPSLADDDRFLDVARAFDRLDAPTALIADSDFGSLDPIDVVGPGATPDEAAAAMAELDGKLISEPFDLVGVGGAEVDGQPSIVVVYHFGSGESAEAAVDSIGAAWSNATLSGGQPIGDVVDLTSVTAEGTTATIVARPLNDRSTTLGERLLFSGEVVFRHR